MQTIFTSRREKRLWIYAALILLAIYSTVMIATPISSILREKNLLNTLFIVCVTLVGGALMIILLLKHRNFTSLGALIGITACYILVLVRIEIPEERTHIIEYSVLAIFIHEALIERNRKNSKMIYPALITLLITGFCGIIDELIQYIIPFRVFDIRDIIFNILAAVMAIGSNLILSHLRTRRRMKIR